MKIAINGFGRMGKLLARIVLAEANHQLVYINDPAATNEAIAHLLAFDSVQGRFKDNEIHADDSHLYVAEQKISLLHESKLTDLPVDNIDLLIDCSGLYRKSELFQPLLDKGLARVLVSCPVKDEGAINLVYGVNHDLYQADKHKVVTAASCTTNCLAPVVKVLKETVGIKRGSMTTIHDITNTQTIVDKAHKDLRRARACGESLIPTSSGSTTAIMTIFPELKGKLDGLAVRVPLLSGSLVDLVIETEKPTSVEEINTAFERAKTGELKGILDIEMRPLVSVDFVGDTHSAIVDGLSTQVIDKHLVKVLAWYDNEINYVSRMNDIVNMIAAS
ncbi:ArsJ-associated glyceraldehyde-3-phosphate dehydrogenase [Pseudoalteromonas spongiae]|uniref:ArsJ-associated glyceraldehyde-3-phosphate dehydrogenase n=1 Tax=Pseudoalteromonas spongiae TaxID=298657 RepID=UPI00110B4787|nr:ArsJ-associated glyceraldehyde-3-phosphate dehydrogenase [Pseudoalteromonas spongiae]TMO85293.1 glyceraldehyde-3-phosphate dehydrogenase [Pseudoalteromonas spongiae]